MPCSSSGACSLRCLPCSRFPWGFSAFFCHRVPVLLLPWWRRLAGNPSLLFSVLLLLRLACRGSLGSAPCVRVLQLGVSALWATVSSPCLLSLTFVWVSFWTVVSTASVSYEVCSLGCPSWFVLLFMSLFVLHLLLGWGGLVTGLWLLCVGLFWSLGCAVLMP